MTFLATCCQTLSVTPWNTLVRWVTCKFVGFTNFVIHVDHSHQLCIFLLVKMPLLHRFCTLKKIAVQQFCMWCSQLHSNVTLCNFLCIVVAMCFKLVPSHFFSKNEHHAFKHSINMCHMKIYRFHQLCYQVGS